MVSAPVSFTAPSAPRLMVAWPDAVAVAVSLSISRKRLRSSRNELTPARSRLMRPCPDTDPPTPSWPLTLLTSIEVWSSWAARLTLASFSPLAASVKAPPEIDAAPRACGSAMVPESVPVAWTCAGEAALAAHDQRPQRLDLAVGREVAVHGAGAHQGDVERRGAGQRRQHQVGVAGEPLAVAELGVDGHRARRPARPSPPRRCPARRWRRARRRRSAWPPSARPGARPGPASVRSASKRPAKSWSSRPRPTSVSAALACRLSPAWCDVDVGPAAADVGQQRQRALAIGEAQHRRLQGLEVDAAQPPAAAERRAVERRRAVQLARARRRASCRARCSPTR